MSLIGEREEELALLLLRRLTSHGIAERLLRQRAEPLGVKPSIRTLMEKAAGIASAVQNGLGYWQIGGEASLNARILSRYYALMHFTFAEQVASLTSDDDLATIQQHTRDGHGLASFAIDDMESRRFPADYAVGVLNRGHFFEYFNYLGLSAPTIGRPQEPVPSGSKILRDAVTILDLLRRIPELMPVIHDHVGFSPLALHVYHAQGSGGGHVPIKHSGVWIGIGRNFRQIDLEYLKALDLPLDDLTEVPPLSPLFPNEILGHLKNSPTGAGWFQALNTYKSRYCPTTYVLPLWGSNDVFVLHLLLLYGLSIVVRYKPKLWHEITAGELTQVGALLEYYLSMVDKTLPLRAFERITGEVVDVESAGSLFAPT